MKALALVALLCGVSVGQEFRSAPAKKAKAEYEAELKRLDQLYQQALAKVKSKYVKDLESARKSALIRSDLDEAQAIVEAKATLAAAKSERSPMPDWTVGTKWTFDGKVYCWSGNMEETWANGKLVRRDPCVVLSPTEVVALRRTEQGLWLRFWRISQDKKTLTRNVYEPRGTTATMSRTKQTLR